MFRLTWPLAAIVACGLLLRVGATAQAADQPSWALAGQVTGVWQFHPAFRSADRGPNSLDPGSRGNETVDATAFAGLRPWRGGELWVNAEVDQGFGLSNTTGLAGFASGEAYKVGKSAPYVRLHRAFFRQTFDLGGEAQTVSAAANQMAGQHSADTLVVTVGKFAATDMFDTNTYAHDPKADFLNWALIDSGAFDYAADAWGYSFGAAAEWTRGWWTLRLGAFDLSKVPNGTVLELGYRQFEAVGEIEARTAIGGRNGKVKLLAYINRGRMGAYDDAVGLALRTGGTPEMAPVRRYGSRVGAVVNAEQELGGGLGAFLRLSVNDGRKEAYEFTEINRSAAAGVALAGGAWGRPDDTVGLATVINGLSAAAKRYFAAGGIGILIGDGRLDHAGPELIGESYYRARLLPPLDGTLDFQLVGNPAYNRDRGPVAILAVRLHAAF